MPLTEDTMHLHQKSVDLQIEEKKEEVVSKKLCNAEKVSNS
jgi:hypothetical protein